MRNILLPHACILIKTVDIYIIKQFHLLPLSQFHPDIFFPKNIVTGPDTATSGSALERLNINPDTIAISGFSSGGAFSTQFHVAFSQKVDNI